MMTTMEETPLPDTEEEVQEPVDSPAEEKAEAPSLDGMLALANVAEKIEQDKRDKIGEEVVRGFEQDLKSRETWEKKLSEWTKLALQVSEQKTYPWPGASNVKYPLLSTAAMQFAARAYPALVPVNGNVVNVRGVGFDPQGIKDAKARAVSKDMSGQILYEMDDWEDEMDKLLLVLPIAGCAFKKTYYNNETQRVCSRFVHPLDLVVDYFAKSLEDAQRKTEVCFIFPNEVEEKKRLKEYLNVDLGEPQRTKLTPVTKATGTEAPTDTEYLPHTILEQHGFYDLDGDGYKEPYIFYVDYSTKKLLRMVARWDSRGIKMDGKKVVKITPVEYYTKFPFIQSPDGSFYDVGFGLLLGSLNHAVDSIVNQLTDAGSMSNLQAGFLGKGLRVRSDQLRFRPGEWKEVNATGQDLKQQIFPLPVREPSDVLFKLLGMLVESGTKLASVAEIFVGKMPGQNTPATTTMETVNQGMKLFTAIYKRNYRALEKELKKIYRLNQIYRTDEQIQRMLDAPQPIPAKQLYDIDNYDICPSADPASGSQQERVQKAARLVQLLALGLNGEEVKRRILEAEEYPAIEKLLQVPPPQPDPEILLKNKDIDNRFKIESAKVTLLALESEAKQILAKAQAMLAVAKAASEEKGMALEEYQMVLDEIAQFQSAYDQRMSRIDEINKHSDNIQLQKNQQGIDLMSMVSAAAEARKDREFQYKQKKEAA